MQNHKLQLAVLVAAGALFAASLALAEEPNQEGQESTVVTVLSKNEIPGGIPQDALHLKIDGKVSTVTGWTALHNPESPLQVVVLIDDDARSSLGVQMNDIANFIKGLPPNAEVALAYMENGRAALAGPLTTDHSAAVNGLHMPLGGMPGVSASPYFCLSDLAKNWPSNNTHARREVVMVTDGVDYYEIQYDPDDPYVASAIADSIRAHLIVYSIYWRNQGFLGRTGYADFDGQNLLAQLTEATGGNSYWQGYGNPVSLEPYFSDISRRFDNQYELNFMAPLGSKPQMRTLKLKVSAKVQVDAPQQVYVHARAE